MHTDNTRHVAERIAKRWACRHDSRNVRDSSGSAFSVQLEIEVLYNPRCESAESMYDLRDVVFYLAQRVGLLHGRVWFGAAMAVNAALTAKQRRNFPALSQPPWAEAVSGVRQLSQKQPGRLGKAAGERAPYPARISVVRPTGEVA
jgi:hypothetical protein